MLKSEELYVVVQSIQRFSRQVKTGEALCQGTKQQHVSRAAEFLLGLVDEAKMEVENCLFARSEKQARYLQELNNFRAKLLEQLINRDKGSTGPIFAEGPIERLGAIADSVSERLEQGGEPLDRTDFISRTSNLIDEVKDWDLEQYKTRALVLGLGLIRDMASASDLSVSDAEIRRRIKGILASFAFEFSEMDKEFETKWEKLKRWASFGYKTSSVPLGLTSDVVTIAGLLPKP